MRILVIDDDVPTTELLYETSPVTGTPCTSRRAGRWAANVEDRSLGLAAGFDNYLTKPIKASALRAEVAFQGSWPRPARRAVVPSRVAAVHAEEPATAIAPVAAPPPRRRGVLGGLVVVALGVPFVLQPLGVPNAASYLFLSMGAAFLIAYLRGHQYVYLIPMVTLCSFGVALLLPDPAQRHSSPPPSVP